MQKIQRFGGAMIIPVMLFAFFGIIVGVTTFFQQEVIFGTLANPDGFFWKLMDVIQQGGWTVFNQINLLFVIGLPISLANKQQARASMESFVVYMVFNYFLSAMLGHWGSNFGVDFSLDAGGESGLAMVAGVKTLDIGMIGAIAVTLIVIYLHNKYFDLKVPEWLTAFRGSATVVAIGFFVMLPVAAVFMMVWPQVQNLISSLQVFIINSGTFGVWLYTFLERLLIPTGMHHILNTPFQFDNIVINGGLLAGWVNQLPEIARSSGESLRTLFPAGGYALYGLSKVFAPIGISYAFYQTAHEDKKAEVAGLMVPVTLTAIVAGVTEPIEFTFLFIAPILFLVHALLAATFITVVYIMGISGYFTGGLIEMTSYNFLPLGASHWQQYLLLLGIGLVFSGVWFIVFKTIIVKMDLKTPGREDDEEEMRLYSKKEYQESRNKNDLDDPSNDPTESRESTGDLSKPEGYLQALGGKENIESVTNCVTRLRVTVKDQELVAPEFIFKKYGALGLVHKGNNVQVIDGTDVTFTREEFEELL